MTLLASTVSQVKVTKMSKWVFLFFLFFFLLGPHLWYMEVPRLGVELILLLPAYTTAMATQDLSDVCNLYHSSGHHRILNPLSEAGD